jgi:hypothetical protein
VSRVVDHKDSATAAIPAMTDIPAIDWHIREPTSAIRRPELLPLTVEVIGGSLAVIMMLQYDSRMLGDGRKLLHSLE